MEWSRKRTAERVGWHEDEGNRWDHRGGGRWLLHVHASTRHTGARKARAHAEGSRVARVGEARGQKGLATRLLWFCQKGSRPF